jgi:protein-tyrosine kinase
MSGPKEIHNGIRPAAAVPRPVAATEAHGMNPPNLAWRGSPVQFSIAPTQESPVICAENAERLREELRVIKRRLLGMQRSANKPRGNIFMIASALPGDGKSFIAWNLAKSLAADPDHEVILIDGDFRKPHLTHSFGLQGQPGFLEVMAGSVALADAGHPIENGRFIFIAAGTDKERANERLASKSTQALIDTHFAKPGRVVVFDSAPILRASESQVLAHSVGRIVLVVRASRTPKRALEQALHVIGGPENCTLVLNDADVPPLSRYSAGSYGYGYGNWYGK